MRVVDPIDGTAFASSSTSDEDLPTRIGVLQLQSDVNFLGYLKDPEATAETLTNDGFVDTGDLVILDERTRHLWLVGRKKVRASGGSLTQENTFSAVCRFVSTRLSVHLS
jgi:long-subunit acyl-CoA synthetase (AMP-forming)